VSLWYNLDIMKDIPTRLKGILWSREVEKLNPQKDKSYIINQVLSFGSLKEVKWLFKKYPKKEIGKIFLSHPRKVYTPQSFNFVKNHLLKITRKLSASKYVKSLY